MPDNYELDGLLLRQLGLRLQPLDGPDSVPPLRGDDIVVPAAPGRMPMPHQVDARRIALALTLDDPDAEEILIRQNLTQLGRAFSRTRWQLRDLVRNRSDGTRLVAQARVVDWVPKDSSQVGILYEGTVDFELPDPYFYGPDVVLAPVAIAASPTDITIEHPGDDRGHQIVFSGVGPLGNVRITNLANGMWVEVDSAVSAGNLLTIDVARKVALNNGVSAIASVRHSGDFQWMAFDPGDNPLAVTATTLGGTLAATFSPNYL